MATQRCPQCRSKRIKKGYRPTPFILKCFFYYNLHCVACNLEFKGFGVPGTVDLRIKKSFDKK